MIVDDTAVILFVGNDTPVNVLVDDTAVILKLVTILLSTRLLTIPLSSCLLVTITTVNLFC